MTFRIPFLALCAAAFLAGCGSSGGSDSAMPDPSSPETPSDPAGPEPLTAYPTVFAPVLFPPGSPALDAAFNMPTAEITARGTGDTSRVAIYGIEFDSFSGTVPLGATLTLPGGGTVALTRATAGDEFEGTDGINDYTIDFGPDAGTFYTMFTLASAPVGGGQDLGGIGIVGVQTRPEDIPGGGTGTYSGNAFGFVQLDGLTPLMPPSRADGTFALTVDFAAARVTGDVFRNPTTTLSIADGRVTDNTFQGRLSSSSPSIGTLNGRVDGMFFGSTANEAGGTFEGSFTTSGNRGTVSGVFGGGL